MKFVGKLLDGFRKLAKRQADRFWDSVVLNPVAWFLFVLLIVAEHGNYKLQGQLDTVCDAIEIPELLRLVLFGRQHSLPSLIC